VNGNGISKYFLNQEFSLLQSSSLQNGSVILVPSMSFQRSVVFEEMPTLNNNSNPYSPEQIIHQQIDKTRQLLQQNLQLLQISHKGSPSFKSGFPHLTTASIGSPNSTSLPSHSSNITKHFSNIYESPVASTQPLHSQYDAYKPKEGMELNYIRLIQELLFLVTKYSINRRGFEQNSDLNNLLGDISEILLKHTSNPLEKPIIFMEKPTSFEEIKNKNRNLVEFYQKKVNFLNQKLELLVKENVKPTNNPFFSSTDSPRPPLPSESPLPVVITKLQDISMATSEQKLVEQTSSSVSFDYEIQKEKQKENPFADKIERPIHPRIRKLSGAKLKLNKQVKQELSDVDPTGNSICDYKENFLEKNRSVLDFFFRSSITRRIQRECH